MAWQIFTLVFLTASVHAKTFTAQTEGIWDTHASRWLALPELAALAKPGDIYVFGEDHAVTASASLPDTYIHHQNQLRLVQALQKSLAPQGAAVSVGMEFLNYTNQAEVDQFLAGQLSEPDFLKASGWSLGNPFEFYRAQILAPAHTAGRTFALNIPQRLAQAVGRNGRASLTPADQALLPPVWELGEAGYFARFSELVKEHATPAQVDNFFWAQCLWDDTMAWKALQPDGANALVIVVGMFHVQYGGGLPQVLKKQTSRRVQTVLQIETDDWSKASLDAATENDPIYGAQADYLWVHTGVTPYP